MGIGGVEDVTQLVPAQAVLAGEEGVEFGSQLSATIKVEGEGGPSVPQSPRPMGRMEWDV